MYIYIYMWTCQSVSEDDSAAEMKRNSLSTTRCQTKKRPESVLAAFELSFAPCPTSSSITIEEACWPHRKTTCITGIPGTVLSIHSEQHQLTSRKQGGQQTYQPHLLPHLLHWLILGTMTLRWELRLGTLGEHSHTNVHKEYSIYSG